MSGHVSAGHRGFPRLQRTRRQRPGFVISIRMIVSININFSTSISVSISINTSSSIIIIISLVLALSLISVSVVPTSQGIYYILYYHILKPNITTTYAIMLYVIYFDIT